MIYYILLALIFNYFILFNILNINIVLKILILLFLLGFYIYFNFKPRAKSSLSKRLTILIRGYELVLASAILLVFEIMLYFYLLLALKVNVNTYIIIINGILSILLIAAMLINGAVRIFAASSQLGSMLRLSFIFFFWVPIVNLFIFYVICKSAKQEYIFEQEKSIRNASRIEKEVCKTRYPILMIHGIFFRDWKIFNYWGRIPSELTNNGAIIRYGNQQSSTSVEQSANEIKQRIFEILKEFNCEKVNIIAHSKGGIDARYAISCLGMGEYVASLTTINTPHMGCDFAGKLIKIAPDKFVLSVSKKYDALFAKLGDDKPDFFSGVSELTIEKCAELNEKMADHNGTLYQSVGSKMKSRSSASFPLNVGFSIIKALDGDNDGLVATQSMKWGKFLGVQDPKGNKGISHGDMIDLTRKNIYGFDVCEFYVSLVNGLKERSL